MPVSIVERRTFPAVSTPNRPDFLARAGILGATWKSERRPRSFAIARHRIACWGRRRLRYWKIPLFATIWLTALTSSGAVRANVIVDVNNALLNIIQTADERPARNL